MALGNGPPWLLLLPHLSGACEKGPPPSVKNPKTHFLGSSPAPSAPRTRAHCHLDDASQLQPRPERAAARSPRGVLQPPTAQRLAQTGRASPFTLKSAREALWTDPPG